MNDSLEPQAGFRQTLWRARIALVLPLLLVIGACAIGPQAREQPAQYDLGQPSNPATQTARIRTTLWLPAVSAPAWLDGHGIVYRLSYQDAGKIREYANSRWVAAPAALLTQRVRSRFAAAASGVIATGDGARADHVLRIELEEFSQTFTAAGQSQVMVKTRATLINPGTRALLAQRTFTAERPAAPDAAGAVKALSEASDDMIERLLGWTVAHLKN
ncbi:MAG: ABC-type transport auxiliary lipoprotein family protein [Burkholderiales bacterium]|nr:ABC-type transport auxiliary lipoprotein family protein [Burkholderiales bacterium]